MLGTTFSEFRIQQLGYPVADALTDLLDFQFDVARIGVYWNAIENAEHTYDISSTKYILDRCQSRGQNVMLSIGVKSPRWPEFHIPDWATARMKHRFLQSPLRRNPLDNLSDQILDYMKNMVTVLRHYTCVRAWQIENEPMDPSGPNNWTVPEQLLHREIDLVKSLDSRPIIINVWGNTLSRRRLLQKIPPGTDIIGLDLYYKVPDTSGYFYTAPVDSDTEIQSQLDSLTIPAIITELQAEPWENRKQLDTPSMSPVMLEYNVRRVLEHIRVDCVLLWGFEYWYERKKRGDLSYYDTVRTLINQYTTPSGIFS